MHECIPYAKFIVLRFIEPWWFMDLSERINAFPTKLLDKFQFRLSALISKLKSIAPQPVGADAYIGPRYVVGVFSIIWSQYNIQPGPMWASAPTEGCVVSR